MELNERIANFKDDSTLQIKGNVGYVDVKPNWGTSWKESLGAYRIKQQPIYIGVSESPGGYNGRCAGLNLDQVEELRDFLTVILLQAGRG